MTLLPNDPAFRNYRFYRITEAKKKIRRLQGRRIFNAYRSVLKPANRR
ncbi:hypothetical protein HMPREF1250_1847 [Megasphaera vaginalis (ex Srinivasan et al. 2021)]|uniref:Uncharacterized protein n=1 Tax=Megasphaera vaginalis (ex Srinivasan et al. 2021) TaxID=1111454 RepID=U7UH89_9FIRM|nr:hypothetical protein HMPREF1250_1847 [Megasphaera vaginalis (ex Srinivasan et al. 2021)]